MEYFITFNVLIIITKCNILYFQLCSTRWDKNYKYILSKENLNDPYQQEEEQEEQQENEDNNEEEEKEEDNEKKEKDDLEDRIANIGDAKQKKKKEKVVVNTCQN